MCHDNALEQQSDRGCNERHRHQSMRYTKSGVYLYWKLKKKIDKSIEENGETNTHNDAFKVLYQQGKLMHICKHTTKHAIRQRHADYIRWVRWSWGSDSSFENSLQTMCPKKETMAITATTSSSPSLYTISTNQIHVVAITAIVSFAKTHGLLLAATPNLHVLPQLCLTHRRLTPSMGADKLRVFIKGLLKFERGSDTCMYVYK